MSRRFAFRRSNGLFLLAVAVIFLLFFTGYRWLNPPPDAGYTEVNASVGENGEARVSIPIAIPKGTVLTPELSIGYNSQAGNGLLGQGFQLEGLYTISRVGANKAQDGLIDGVDFDASDRFAMNGERLVKNAAGVYGSDGMDYRTEQNNFTKVVSYGGTNISPQYFKAWTKSGLILEFGNTSDSRIEATAPNNAHPLVWLVNKISDTKGNYMTFEYIENATNGEYRIDKINYTGNANASPALVPYNLIQFTYQNRPDSSASYLAGSKLKTTQRLSEIKVFEHGNVYRTYELSYSNDVAVKGSRQTSHLSQIVEKGANNVPWSAPVKFDWTIENVFATQENTFATAYNDFSAQPDRIRVGDVTGDGKMDIVIGPNQSTGDWYVLKSTGKSFTPETWATNTPAFWRTMNQRGIRLMDVNSDGKIDVSVGPDNTGKWEVLLSTGTGFTSAQTWATGAYANYYNLNGLDRVWSMDANGDGKTDFIIGPDAGGNWSLMRNTGSSFVNDGAWISGAYGNWDGSANRIHPMDATGDGLTDFVIGPDAGGNWYVLKNTGISFLNSGAWVSGAFGDWADKTDRTWTIDFEGDGLQDFVFGPAQGTGKWFLLRNRGASFENAGEIANGFYASWFDKANRIRPTDINGDGLTDFIFGPEQGTGNWYSLYNKGTGFEYGYDIFNNQGYWLAGFFETWWDDPNLVRSSDVNGDGVLDFVLGPEPGTGKWEVISNQISENHPHLLKSLTNGHGATTEFVYEEMTRSDTYQKGTGALFPKMDFIAPIYLVRQVKMDNGIGGQNEISYKYFDAKLDLDGRGFRGFGKTETVDTLRGTKTITTFDRRHQFLSTKVSGSEQFVWNSANNTWKLVYSNFTTTDTIEFNAEKTIHFSHPDTTIEKWYEFNAAGNTPFKTKLTDYTYDVWGNPTVITEDYNNGQYTISTTNTYTNTTSGGLWLLGRLTSATVTKHLQGKPPITKTSTFAYETNTGILTQEVLNSSSTTLKLQKDYALDVFGNRIAETVSGPGITARTTNFTFDTKGRNVIKIKNPLNHEVNYTYYPETALPQTTTDPNLLAETTIRDGFGRPTSITHPDGTMTSILYNKCDGSSNCPPNAVWYTETFKPDGGQSITYYDVLDREVRQSSWGLNGTVFHTDTRYDALGRVAAKTDPYSTTPVWHTFNYDAQHRLIQETAPGGRVSTMTYNGLTTISTNPQGQKSTKVVNSMDWLTQSKDHFNNTVNYGYDSDGNMTTVTDPVGNITTMTYDSRGNKTSMDDPDLGEMFYDYNTLGLLTTQTYPNGDTIGITYDLLNRKITQTEPERQIQWEYDTKPKGKGKIAFVRIGGVVSEEYSYYTTNSSSSARIGKLQNQTQTIEGTPYTSIYTYDVQGRLATLQYPVTNFKLAYDYDVKGNLKQVKRFGTNPIIYWQADSLNNKGQLSKFTLGNGLITRHTYNDQTGFLEKIRTGTTANAVSLQNLNYQWSPIGNLNQRQDLKYGLTENFQFDSLNRLTQTQVVGQNAVTIQYNSIGNITFKSNVGTYTYGQNGAGPHMVTSINHAGIQDCFYGFQGTVDYNSYNYATKIKDGQDTISLTYDASRMKQTQRLVKNGTLKWTKHYIGGMMERVVENGQTKYLHHIRAGGETVAVLQRIGTTAALDTLRYLHKDHLGSLQSISRDNGTLYETFSYDAWGKPRFPTNWAPMLVTAPLPPYQRGYTMHEMMGIEDLIHMNARLYDPAIGRMLSPDPFVQMPENLQSLNRASYVLNNPLSFTDPTGFFSFKKFFKKAGDFIQKNAGTIAAIAIAVITAVPTGGTSILGLSGFLGTVASGAASGFGGAFVGTLANGGGVADAFRNGLKGGAIGALTAAVIYGVQQAGTELLKDWNRDGSLYHVDGRGNYSAIKTPMSKNVFVNGIKTSLEDAVAYGREAYKGKSFDLFYNPSHGFFSDILESSLDKFGIHTGISQQFSEIVGNYSVVKAFSQGTIITTSAIEFVSAQGKKLPNLTVDFYGAGVNEFLSKRSITAAGAKTSGQNWYQCFWLDPVCNIGGLNGNPVKIAGSILASPTLPFSQISTHSSFYFK